MLKNISIKGKAVEFPVFFPDATKGIVRACDSKDLKDSKVEGIIVNTYHLLKNPGIKILKKYDGIKNFSKWDGFVISDSGGFQLLSMVSKDKSLGEITEDGILFRDEKEEILFTPEKCIQTQFAINSDIMICLDYCPPEIPTAIEMEKSVEITVKWAQRCKEEYNRIIKENNIPDSERPLLFGVIQGGNDKKLRYKCAEELKKIGFDGYGFGGWPLDSKGKLDDDILQYTCSLMPDNLPKYALGVGSYEGILKGVTWGYDIFDCILPTRDARNGRIYNLKLEKGSFDYLYITDDKYLYDETPLDSDCDCYTCQNYTRSFVSYLFRNNDRLASRLATIHNLRTYTRLFEILKQQRNG
jgi:queuine tRNA-ribosyltransferase